MKTSVKSFMSGRPVSIEPGMPALAALDLMVEHGIRHLPVVDGQRQVIGILSIDDLRAAFPFAVNLKHPPNFSEREDAAEETVGDVMTYAPTTIHCGEPLEFAAQQMAEGRFGCLPVVDEDGRLEGILTETDVLQAIATTLWADRVGDERTAVGYEAGILAELRAERDRILAQIKGVQARQQEVTHLRRDVPLDNGELGTYAEERRVAEGVSDFAMRRLRSLEHALERAEAGAFGICESCEGKISAGRLRAFPAASLCIRCAMEAEAGGR